jgi:hypothetical protein
MSGLQSCRARAQDREPFANLLARQRQSLRCIKQLGDRPNPQRTGAAKCGFVDGIGAGKDAGMRGGKLGNTRLDPHHLSSIPVVRAPVLGPARISGACANKTDVDRDTHELTLRIHRGMHHNRGVCNVASGEVGPQPALAGAISRLTCVRGPHHVHDRSAVLGAARQNLEWWNPRLRALETSA